LGNLFRNYYEAVSVILFGIGFTTLLFHRNMIKKIIGFNIMDTAVYLFLAAKGYIAGRAAPVPESAQTVKTVEDFINPSVSRQLCCRLQYACTGAITRLISTGLPFWQRGSSTGRAESKMAERHGLV